MKIVVGSIVIEGCKYEVQYNGGENHNYDEGGGGVFPGCGGK